MQLNRIEHGLTAEVWDVSARRRRCTTEQVAAYHARFRQLYDAERRDFAAQLAAHTVRSSKHVRREIRAAWLKRSLGRRGPGVVNAYQRRIAPRSLAEGHQYWLQGQRSAPGVYASPCSAPDLHGLWIYVLGERGRLIVLTEALGTDAQQAAAINHAVAYYRSAVARRSAA